MTHVAAVAALCAATVLPGAAPGDVDAHATLLGQWVGTVDLRGTPAYFTMSVSETGGVTQASYVVPAIDEVERTASNFHAAAADVAFGLSLGTPGTLRARYDDRTMDGTLTIGDRSTPIHLRHFIRRPWHDLRPYAGDYVLPGGDEVVVSAPYTYLAYFDRESRRSGLLASSGGDEFFGGPGRRVFAPASIDFSFVRDANGAVIGANISRSGLLAAYARRTIRSTSRDVTFPSNGAVLSGTFTTPLGNGPFPAIVMFAGSNEQTRDAQYGIIGFAADEFLRHGIAVFAYDKRGFAESTGERTDAYSERDGIAAVQTVRSFREVDQSKVGLWGISQGGMIEPGIARADGHIAFIINVSGSMASGNAQEIERVELQMRADGFPEADIVKAVAFQKLKFHYAETGEDWDAYTAAYHTYEHAAWFPDPYIGPPADKTSRAWQFWREQGMLAPADTWSYFHGPVLYLQADLEKLSDRAHATDLFRAAMSRAGNHQYEDVIVPHAEHTMFLARTGGELEDRNLSTIAPEYYPTMLAWLRNIGVVP